jgi:hypothetical protein
LPFFPPPTAVSIIAQLLEEVNFLTLLLGTTFGVQLSGRTNPLPRSLPEHLAFVASCCY